MARGCPTFSRLQQQHHGKLHCHTTVARNIPGEEEITADNIRTLAKQISSGKISVTSSDTKMGRGSLVNNDSSL